MNLAQPITALHRPVGVGDRTEFLIQVGLPGHFYEPRFVADDADRARALWNGVLPHSGYVARLLVNGELTALKSESGEERKVDGDPFDPPVRRPYAAPAERRRLRA